MSDQAARLREMVRQIKNEEGVPAPQSPEKAETPMPGRKRAAVYCITSGKGGVGKTSFTVNFAIALARCGKKVAILDADFGFSNVNILLGANTRYNMSHVLSGEKRLDEVIEECFPNIWHISGGTGLLELVSVDEGKLGAALAQMEALDDLVDYILIDTGAGLNNNILRMISASDKTVLVMTSEPTSILDSYVMLKATSMLERKPEIYALINKADSEKSAKKTYESFSNVVEKHLKCKVDMLGFIPQDDRMSDSISSLVPYAMQYPTRLLTMQMQAIANQIAEQRTEEKKPGGFRHFFSQLLGRGDVTV